MAFGNATKGYVKAHSGGGGSGTDNYNNLSNKPKINGVALSGNKTSADLNIETGTDDYEDLTNKPSINGVELLGDKVVGLLSSNIHIDYTKLTDLPSINGVTLSGNKTSADLHISGSGSSDYTDLTNKPSINGVELLGDKEVGLLSSNIHIDYTKLTNTPSINGVALSGNKTSSDLHIETGTDDYTDLTNKPSINGVELLGDKEVGLLSSNIHIDYTKLTNTPSINGVALSGNKTSADLNIETGTDDYTDLTNKPSINGVTLTGNKTSSDLHITGGNITSTSLWTNDGTHDADTNGPFNLSADVTTFKFIKFIFRTNNEFTEVTMPASKVTEMINTANLSAYSKMESGDAFGAVSSWPYQTAGFAQLPSATTVLFKIMWSDSRVKLKLWEVVGIN